MPVNAYFHGHGDEVKASMAREYGAKKGERVFYATANKRNMTPRSGRKSTKMTTKRP
jgi:hypothetical protein